MDDCLPTRDTSIARVSGLSVTAQLAGRGGAAQRRVRAPHTCAMVPAGEVRIAGAERAPDIGVMSLPRSSRQRYRRFVDDYKHRRLDDGTALTPSGNGASPVAPAATERRGRRRQYIREYLRWLRPYRYAVVGLFALALFSAGLQMIEPLFMRFIIDRVLLNPRLDAARLRAGVMPLGAKRAAPRLRAWGRPR